jgi:hypothetical protein
VIAKLHLQKKMLVVKNLKEKEEKMERWIYKENYEREKESCQGYVTRKGKTVAEKKFVKKIVVVE